MNVSRSPAWHRTDAEFLDNSAPTDCFLNPAEKIRISYLLPGFSLFVCFSFLFLLKI